MSLAVNVGDAAILIFIILLGCGVLDAAAWLKRRRNAKLSEEKN